MAIEITKSALDQTVQGIVKDVVDAEFAELRERIEALAAARPAAVDPRDPAPQKTEQSAVVGGIVRALRAAKGIPRVAAEIAAERYGADHAVTKALTLGSESDGGFLVPTEYAAEVIELLYARAVVMRFNPRMLSIAEGEVQISRLATGSTFSWSGEGENIQPSQPSFDALKLRRHKGTILVPISNDLLRTRSGARADGFVRDDMVAGAATGLDVAFIRGAGTENSPKGLLYRGVQTPANGTVNLANVTADLVNAIKRMMDANLPLGRLGWMMGTSAWAGLMSSRDGNGNYTFKPEMENGTLFSYPFEVTSSVPSGASGEVYLSDFDHVVVGESDGLIIDASSDAAYDDGGTVRAAFSRDESVIRAIIYTDLILRHADACQIITSADWASIPAA